MAQMKWLYTLKGEPAYYQTGEFLFDAITHKPVFFERDDWIHSMDGKPIFFIAQGWLLTREGAKAFYYG